MFYVGLIISSLQLYEYPLGIHQCKQILIQLFFFNVVGHICDDKHS